MSRWIDETVECLCGGGVSAPRVGWIPALVVMMTVTLSAWAGEGEGERSTPQSGAAIAGFANLENEDDLASFAGAVEELQEQADREPDANGPAERFKRASDDRRLARRRGVAGVRTTPAAGEPAPWYRSAMGSLALVLVLVGIAYAVVKRFVPAARAAEGDLVCVVARAALSPKQSVALVRLGRRFVMIGVSPDRLDTLCEIHDGGEVAELAARLGPVNGKTGGGFDKMLLRHARELREVEGEAEEESPSPKRRIASAREPLTDLLNRLRTLQSK